MTVETTRRLTADAVTAGSILLLGIFLFFSGAGLMKRWEQAATRRQGPDVDDLLGAVAVSAGLAIVAWWAFSMLLAAAAAAFEKSGRRHAAATAGKCCPAFMRRLAVAAFSVQLLSAPLAQAAVPPPGPAWVPTQEVAIQAQWAPTAAPARPVPVPVPVPEKPATPAPATPSPRPQAPAAPPSDTTQVQGSPDTEAQVPAPQATELPPPELPTAELQPTEPGPTEPPAPAVRPEWRPSPPVADPGLLAAQPVRAAHGPQETPRNITVLAGDTLWDIASRELGPSATDVDVALQWPRWYEANKAQIGASPHVLLPGQILKSPSTT